MSYCTDKELLEDISEDLLIQLTDENNVGMVNWGTVEKKRLDVDALIDGYCAIRYPVPFDPVPRIIKRLGKQLLVFELYNLKLGAPENLEKQHTANLKLLKDLSDGTVRITGSTGVAAPEAITDPGLTVVSAKQQFPHDKWDKF